MKESAASLVRKSLRRFQQRALPDWRIRQVLEREFKDLVASHGALRPEMDELRRAAPERLAGFDNASDLALQRLGEQRFDLALGELQKAGRELAELRRCVDVAVGLRQAAAALAGVEDLLSAGLAALSTARVLRRLHDLGRALLDQGEARKARFVIVLLSDQIRRVSTRSPRDSTPGSERFERMLQGLEPLDEAAVAQIRKLRHEGYHHLAERLAEDLEAELAVSDRAHRSSSAGGSLGGIESDLAAVRRQAQAAHQTLTQWIESSS